MRTFFEKWCKPQIEISERNMTLNQKKEEEKRASSHPQSRCDKDSN